MIVNSHLHFVSLQEVKRQKVSRTNVKYKKPVPNKNLLLGFPHSFQREIITEDSIKDVETVKVIESNVHFLLAFNDHKTAHQLCHLIDINQPLSHACILPHYDDDVFDETNIYNKDMRDYEVSVSEEYIDENGDSLLLFEQDRLLFLDKENSNYNKKKQEKQDGQELEEKDRQQLEAIFQRIEKDIENENKKGIENQILRTNYSSFLDTIDKTKKDVKRSKLFSTDSIDKTKQKPNRIPNHNNNSSKRYMMLTKEITDVLNMVIMNNIGIAIIKSLDNVKEDDQILLAVDLVHPCHEQNIVKAGLDVLYHK